MGKVRYKAVNVLTDLEVVGTREELAEITGLSYRAVTTYIKNGTLYKRKWKFYNHYDSTGLAEKAEDSMKAYDPRTLNEWDEVMKKLRKSMRVKGKKRKSSGFRTPYNVMR